MIRRLLTPFRRHPLACALLLLAALAAGWWAVRSARADRLLREGEAVLAAREYDRARELLDRYLDSRPDDPRALLLAARAARRQREYYAARDYLRRCREAGGDAEEVAVEEALAAVQRGDGRPVESLRRRADAGDELTPVILEVLIQYDIDTYRLRGALHGLTRYLELRPGDLQALLSRGYVWERFLYFADALADYRRAVASHPDSEEARRKLGETLLVVGTPAEALEQFEWLARRRPDDPQVRLGLARCHKALGRAGKARALLDALLEAFPGHGEALWERGQIALDGGAFAEAEAWLRRAADILPHDRRVSYSLYRCLLALDRKEEAEAVNERVKRIDADLRRLDQVRQEVMERPDDAGLRCEGGLLFLRNGEPGEAARWLRAALRLDPSCEPARAALAGLDAPPPPKE